MDANELLRISREMEEHKKLMGLDRHSLNEARQAYEAIEGIRKESVRLSLPSDLKAHIEEMRRISQETARTFAPMFGTIADANRASLHLFENIRQQQTEFAELIGVAASRSEGWRAMMEAAGAAASATKYLAEHFGLLSERSFLAQANLIGVDLGKQLANLRAPAEVFASSRVAFEGFSTSYKELFESFAVPDTSFLNLPPSLTDFPTNEFFNGSDLIAVTTPRVADNEFAEDVIVVREDIRLETTDLVAERLVRTSPEWIKMLEGARQAIRSDNPDKVRHSVTSLRELSTHILHYLSPDEKLREWSNSAEHFANGRPTRKARLEFITREINHGAFSYFVAKDIEAMVEMIKLFQIGTHSVESKLTEDQVAALIARVEGSILFLFTIADLKD